MHALLLALAISFSDSVLLLGRGIMVEAAVEENGTKSGVEPEAVRVQTEVALRRCGFGVEKESTSSVIVTVTIIGSGASRFAASLLLTARGVVVANDSFFLVDAYTEGTVFAGPNGTAASQLREVLAFHLDALCNRYLKAKEEKANRKK